MFNHIDNYAGDPILSLMEQFNHDQRQHKVNLSIGLYYNEANIVPRLTSVSQVQQHLQQQLTDQAELYLPMQGLAAYNQAVQQLLFGADHRLLQQQRIATVQTIGGSGALKIGADFLRRYFPKAQVWLSQPTWENHIAIFAGAGFKVNTYPYFDPASLSVDFAAMLACLQQLPSQSIVLLHPCCHNPTGADLTTAQWDQIVQLCQQRQLIAFFDLAYQGLGVDLSADCYPIRTMAAAGVATLVANSFSKIFSLYAARIGALSVVSSSAEISNNLLGQLKATVRSQYSSPPSYGAHIVANILNNADYNAAWQAELEQMRQRIIKMRAALVAALKINLPQRDFSHLLQQRGMFSYSGLSQSQVLLLRQEFAIYLLESSRICLAGLNQSNVGYVAQAIASVCAKD